MVGDNVQSMTPQARADRAIARLRECTTSDDLERVWGQMSDLRNMLLEASNKSKDGAAHWAILKKLHHARLDVFIDIEGTNATAKKPRS